MHGRALIRLRASFVALGLLLLLPLFLLLREVEARLEEQRRLRHEIVAERVFDEMERELTALLEAERQRPSAAYDAEHTQATAWSPFVVGYFKRNADELQLLAHEQLTAGRAARVERAVAAFWRSDARPSPREPTEADEDRWAGEHAKPMSSRAQGEAPFAPDLKQEAKQEAVLRQLNRAASERLQKKAPSKSKLPEGSGDPLQGL